MKSAVVLFPASNGDRDMIEAFTRISGTPPEQIAHDTTPQTKYDLIGIPGGFSFGDHLRPGAIAARCKAGSFLREQAAAGAVLLGLCNGFQILCELGLLPGALTHNRQQTFISREQDIYLPVSRASMLSRLHGRYACLPIAHIAGCYVADEETLSLLERENRIVMRYCGNPNGSANAIAGLCDATGRVIGMMPHPERAVDPLLGKTDGALLLECLFSGLCARHGKAAHG